MGLDFVLLVLALLLIEYRPEVFVPALNGINRQESGSSILSGRYSYVGDSTAHTPRACGNTSPINFDLDRG
ncbi:hypothetical protein BDP55DRAFT_652551 [Colletotrichum godetiae]|uniref:Uncharacterized protein n=1 Tax=Colletotrichum godetiae TaxID=1209918 RepID=A0AAJ0F220_9PEZI|nr:uncharacterized protein BDP55DRAFT_652551 [Colletotrichum godetiae]KAK1690057.1 hypothetical protein BDP55DRAFT_652551 [Colletotrichum godetiae]